MLDSIVSQGKGRFFCIESAPGAAALGAAEVLARVHSAAGQLRGLGLQSGDRALFRGDQGLPAFVAFWAAVANGASLVPVDPTWPAPMCRRILERIEPRLTIIESSNEDSPWLAASASTHLVPIDQEGRVAGIASGTFALPEVPGSAPAACLFTSGSTADPKAVVLSRDALLRSGALVVESFGWSRDERLLNLADPHTMSGLRNAFLAAPLGGMRWVCSPRSGRADIFSLLELLRHVSADRIVAAPLLLRHINLLGERVPMDLFSSTRAMYCTGTDLHATEVQRFHARFNVPVINYYGLTETVGLCLTQRLEHWRPDDASIGYPVGCEIRIVDERGTRVPVGAAGELQVRQSCGMSGYFADRESTARILRDGWLCTGDLVRQRADGSVVIVGRLANFIKVPTTEKIHPREIEVVLEQHELVAEAAVCGLPDVAGGERIAALLVAKSANGSKGCSPGDIAQFVVERLGPARAPRAIRWVGSIPRGANGKIARARLSEHFND